jgi:hypothetical protein
MKFAILIMSCGLTYCSLNQFSQSFLSSILNVVGVIVIVSYWLKLLIQTKSLEFSLCSLDVGLQNNVRRIDNVGIHSVVLDYMSQS